MKISQKMSLYFGYTMVHKVENDQKLKSRGGSCLEFISGGIEESLDHENCHDFLMHLFIVASSFRGSGQAINQHWTVQHTSPTSITREFKVDFFWYHNDTSFTQIWVAVVCPWW